MIIVFSQVVKVKQDGAQPIATSTLMPTTGYRPAQAAAKRR